MHFKDAVEIILQHEGGHVNDPRDPGGETNFGISKRAYPNLRIQSLTKEDAIQIYKRDYWDRFKIESLPFALRLLVFDCAVNQGGGAAIGLLQSAIGVDVDSNLGEETLSKLQELPLAGVIKKYVYFRWRRYAQSGKFSVYGVGWGKRLLDVSLESVLQNDMEES